MMQQIVYTRCKPRRSLRDEGIFNEEGYGIHNFSEGLITHGLIRDPSLFEKRIPKQNAAVEGQGNVTGIFRSYEYFYDADGSSMLGEENLRPYNAADVRPNGMRHRPGNYVKQYLVGEFENYPCLLFGADFWDAAQKTENSYYHDNGEPLEFLPEIEPEYGAGSISREKVRDFISDGRAECVRQLVSVVISEMSKSMDLRRFIVIKDLPEYVEMWIAAVEFALPVYLAKQISFSTNVVAGVDLSVDNTFYCDADNKLIAMPRKKAIEAGGKKRYYSMIAGIHPADRGSSYFTVEKDNTAFWLLDGQARVFGKTEAFYDDCAFFDAVVKMDEDISGFHSFLSGLVQIEFGNRAGDLYELFDAYHYLFGSTSCPEQWEYKKIISCLSLFEKYERAPYECSQRLAEKIYEMYGSFYEEDEEAGLPLLKQIVSMDHANRLKGDVEAYLLNNYLFELQTDKIDVRRVQALDRAYFTVCPSMEKILRDGFKESIPVFIDYAAAWDSDESYYMFCKLYDCFSAAGTDKKNWYEDKTNACFIELLFKSISRDACKSEKLLAYVKESPVCVELAVRGLCQDSVVWGKIVCRILDDAGIRKVCGRLMEAEGITMGQYEGFLTDLLDAGRENDALIRYLKSAINIFGPEEDCSGKFMDRYLERFGKDAGKLKDLMDEMAGGGLSGASGELLYDAVESYLNDTVKADDAAIKLAEAFEKWGNKLGKPVGRAHFIAFLGKLKSEDTEKAVCFLEGYIDAGESFEITNGDDVQRIVEAAGKKLSDDKILVRLYHILRRMPFCYRRILLLGNSDKPESKEIMRYIKLVQSSNGGAWQEDVTGIKNDLYIILKNCNMDRMEKDVLKAAGREGSCYKQYLKDIRCRIQDEKSQEKCKKKVKAEADKAQKDKDQKDTWFSKFFPRRK